MSTLTWRERGRCKGADPTVFYPEDDEDPGRRGQGDLRDLRVREACLEYALAAREKIGVWGGYTARERRRLVRQRRRASLTRVRRSCAQLTVTLTVSTPSIFNV